MRILFIVQNYVNRGTYLRAFQLAKELQKTGNDMTILASNSNLLEKPSIYITEGIKIIATSNLFPGPIQSGWDIYNLCTRKQAIQKLSFDIVHGFETRPSVIYPALSMKHKGIPLYLDWADWFGKGGSVEERPNQILRSILRPIETYYENHFRNKSCGTTVICETLKRKAVTSGISEDQLCLLYNGFNLPGWSPITIERARIACQVNQNTLIIGYLGSLFPRDALLMAETFNTIHSLRPETHLLHIGVSNYQAKKYIRKPSALIETGPVDLNKMMTYISACDILWLPFHNSPANHGRFPLKFTNYLAAGRPVVATDVGDIPKFINKFQVGKVSEPSKESLSETCLSLLNETKSRQEFGENALALSKLPSQSWAKRAEQLYSFYQKGLSTKHE